MLLLICCFFSLILGLIALNWKEEDLGNMEMTGILLTTVGAFGILMIGLTVPLNHMGVQSEIHKIEAFKDTVKQARNNNMIIEKATIQKRIAKKNEWMRSQKYWNTTVFSMWIPDEVERLEPIK